jgi:membrane protein implicated in regulation of membrane protease activity
MDSLYLACFAFGLLFTVATFLLGALGSGHDLHIPGLNVDVGDGGAHGDGHPHVSPFSLSVISAFLAWFGGAGFVMTRYSTLTGAASLALASAAGLLGGGIVFVVLGRWVFPRLTHMRAEDYTREGTIARVTSGIVEGGTGEIVYTLEGTQHVDGARSASGEALPRGTEVVILKVERGIALVERWDRFADQHHLPRGDSSAV